jgi:hypothetical protein
MHVWFILGVTGITTLRSPVATGLESPVVLGDVVDRLLAGRRPQERRVTTDNPLALDNIAGTGGRARPD